ncbi:MAG: hypothetical protein PSN37_01960 [Alphaproteobacteria bacterium]|nr:hypothetical protein [Alphaproteobacteria bacterium]
MKNKKGTEFPILTVSTEDEYKNYFLVKFENDKRPRMVKMLPPTNVAKFDHKEDSHPIET